MDVKEAEYALRHLHHWMKAEREPTPLLLEPGHVRVRRDPLGVTLIIGAWNEPLMLQIESVQAAVHWTNRNPHPLGPYIFAEDHDVANRILDATGSGDAVVNDCTLQPGEEVERLRRSA